MELNDLPYHVAGIGLENEKGFYSVRQPSRQIPYINNWKNAITIEMSMDRRVYSRKVYAVLDFVSDVGGLFGAISPICILILALVNFWSSYQFLMGDLFVERGKTRKNSFNG